MSSLLPVRLHILNRYCSETIVLRYSVATTLFSCRAHIWLSNHRCFIHDQLPCGECMINIIGYNSRMDTAQYILPLYRYYLHMFYYNSVSVHAFLSVMLICTQVILNGNNACTYILFTYYWHGYLQCHYYGVCEL